MRARSSWLFHPKVKATWVALAAGSLAGLAVLGACSDAPVSKIAGPKIPDPRFVVGANAHVVAVCLNQASPAGSYIFSVARTANFDPTYDYPMFEIAGEIDPDFGFGGNPVQTTIGPYTGDMIVGSTSLATANITLTSTGVAGNPPDCENVFVRATTPGDLLNRLWTYNNGALVNPKGTVIITPLGGATFTAVCLNDDPNLAQTPGCLGGPIPATTIFSSANVFHGSVVTYLAAGTTVTVCPLGSIKSGFNGTSIANGNTVWFNANLKPDGPIVDGTTISFTNSSINLNGTIIPGPSGQVTFSSAATVGTTNYNAGTNTWETIVPLSWDKDVFLTGTAYAPPGGLAGGADVTWSGAFASNTTGVTAKWQFAAAVYNGFGVPGVYNDLGVIPIGNKHGAPWNFRANVVGGARGGGGSNFTGSWSSTKGVCVD